MENEQDLAGVLGHKLVPKSWMKDKRILRELSKGPTKRAELENSPNLQGIARSTIYDRVHYFLHLGIVKELPDKRIAPAEYSPLDQRIEREIQFHRLQLFKEPSKTDIAWTLGREPQDPEFNKAFHRVAKKVKWDSPEVNEVLERYEAYQDEDLSYGGSEQLKAEQLRPHLTIDLAMVDLSMMNDEIRKSLIRLADFHIRGTAFWPPSASVTESRIILDRLDRLRDPRYRELLGEQKWAAFVSSRRGRIIPSYRERLVERKVAAFREQSSRRRRIIPSVH